jgi:signal peptidase I
MNTILKKFWQEWIRPFALVFVIVGPLKSAVADWNWVPTGSMNPSILEGELVAVNKLAYDLKVPFTTTHLSSWANPARGDVVVFYSPADGTRLVKRVIGLPGDTVELRDETVYLNGVPQRYSLTDSTPFRHETFEDKKPVIAVEHLDKCNHYMMALPSRAALRTFGPLVVPPEQYFVMGDSRDNSKDSRFIGSIPRQNILGRVPCVVLSFDPARSYLPRLRRILQGMTVDGA